MTETTFFEPGKTYIQSKPYTAPELLGMFQCEHVAVHPSKGELRAFGFLATVFPGDNWCSGARSRHDWDKGWTEKEGETGA